MRAFLVAVSLATVQSAALAQSTAGAVRSDPNAMPAAKGSHGPAASGQTMPASSSMTGRQVLKKHVSRPAASRRSKPPA